MAIEVNQTIIKQEVIDSFKENLLAILYNNASSQENPPKFTETEGNFTEPNAIDVSQLDTSNYPEVTIPNIVISALDTYNALKPIIDKLTKIRNYISNWYYQTGDVLSLVETKEGTAVFKEVIPGLNTYNSEVKQENYTGWDRKVTGGSNNTQASISLTKTLDVENPFVKGEMIRVNQVQPYTLDASLFNNLFKAWEQEKNKVIEYNFYTCHSNCHSNWSNSRFRR